MIIFYAVAGNNCLFSRNSISKGYFYRIFLKIGSPENRYNVRFPTKNKFKLLQWMLINANVFSLFFFFFFNFYAFSAKVHGLITGQGAKIPQAG